METHGGESESTGGRENESRNFELRSEMLRPTGEHVGDDVVRRRWVRVEPLEKRVVEI